MGSISYAVLQFFTFFLEYFVFLLRLFITAGLIGSDVMLIGQM